MPTSYELLESEALKLTRAERERLAEQLVASLDEENTIEAEWGVEVERRIAEIESGAVAGMPVEEVIAKAYAALK